MARRLRIEFSGALYHVTSRGDQRERICEDDEDRQTFVRVLAGVIKRFAWVCHAYCLMDNHYHLLLETPKPNLSRGMRQLNGVYTQKYNASHRTVGHVFQGRFKAVLIEKERHLLAVSRYVVLNPVRAGMVKQMRQWRWSSYRATAGLCAASPFLTTDWLLRQFGAKRDKAQQAYRRFVREGIGEASPWTNLVGGFLLGGEDFAARCRALILRDATFEDVTRAERSAGRPTLDALFGDVAVADRVARNARIVQAYLEYGYTMRAIADFLDLHYTSISVIVQHGENKTL